MEHRIGSRLQLACDIELFRGDEKSGPYRARDISHGGIFIEDCEPGISSGNLVEVKLALGTSGQQKKYRLRALVVHRSKKGAGLMWAGMDPEFHSELNRLRTEKTCVNA